MSETVTASGRPVLPLRVEPGFEHSYPGAEALATECVLNLAYVAGRCRARVEALVRRHGIPSLAAFNALEVIRGAEQPLPPSLVAERVVVSRSTMTTVLDSLQRRGLIRRHPHKNDKRMHLVEVTDDGAARCRALLPELHRLERQWLAPLDDDERETFVRLLARWGPRVGPADTI